MKGKKLQVFVSSTYMDLKEERQAAVEAILSSGHIPAGMELFSAGDESQMTVIERWIDESDVYLLILGGRYGSVDKKSGKSYTHLEYEYAVKKKIPLFAIVMSDKALDEKIKTLGVSAIEQDDSKGLKDFKSVVVSNLVKFWDDKKDIKLAIHETLSDFSYRKDLVGWTRGGNSVDALAVAEEIARVTKENSDLRKQIVLESGDKSFYSGLSYSQLEELLKRELISIEGKNISLLEFVDKYGEQLVTGLSYSSIGKENFEKLKIYKLVNLLVGSGVIRGYRFTDEGHNFYLKMLSKK